MKIKLLGLGHDLTGDDQVGLEIVQRWKDSHPDYDHSQAVQAEILESPGINLLGALAGLDAAILVAAVQSGAPLGTLHRLDERQLSNKTADRIKAYRRRTAETLSLGRQLVPEDLPEQIILIGIEGGRFTLGEGLSPAVQAAIPGALDMIDETLQELTNHPLASLFRKLRRLFAFLPKLF